LNPLSAYIDAVQISRRDLVRSSAAVGGVAALGGLGLADSAVAAGPLKLTTAKKVLLKGAPGVTGWRPIVTGPGERHSPRVGLGVAAKKGRARRRKSLLAFAQLSDVHICDAQSPMRLDYLDRGDDDDNHDGKIDGNGLFRSAWRPQEILGVHVADAMVRKINQIGRGPVLGQKLALALQTGDNSDTNQRNEIRWNIDVLDGGTVRVDSGDVNRFEGVIDNDPAYYDVRFWHPEGNPAGVSTVDIPRAERGFPVVPGLLDAARAPFEAQGLKVPWYAAMGNHDGLFQGVTASNADTRARAVGDQKKVAIGGVGGYRTVTADPARHEVTRQEWVEEHFTTTGKPVGHGFTADNRKKGTAYYTLDKGVVRFVVLDTVNLNGKESGSIDPAQFKWLKSVLKASRRKLVILVSHHTIETMDNDLTGIVDSKPRVLGTAILPVLLESENVIAWVNGHTHRNQIWAHKRKGGKGGFWEINTASHIDWPQQARLIEIADNRDDTLSIFTTMIDHAGPAEFDDDLTDPTKLAALSRELAANDWQEQQGGDRRGKRAARNSELLVPAPAFLRKKKSKKK
jgi:metallophosphoesterase (TIGR03767 family)